MNKVIILSVQPQWLHKILNGEKTIEIRKSMPKCDYPIDVYLYCIKPNRFPNTSNGNKVQILTFDESTNKYHLYKSSYGKVLNGKIVAKFTLNKVNYTSITVKYGQNITHEYFKDIDIYVPFEKILPKTCLTELELARYEYTNDRFGVFAWHIDNLQIFDEPMELREFYRNCKDYHNGWSGCDDVCGYAENNECYGGKIKINKPPQSWAYAYLEE